MPKTMIVLPNGNAVKATFVEGDQESELTGSPVEEYLRRTDHFVVNDPTDGKFAIAASTVMIKI